MTFSVIINFSCDFSKISHSSLGRSSNCNPTCSSHPVSLCCSVFWAFENFISGRHGFFADERSFFHLHHLMDFLNLLCRLGTGADAQQFVLFVAHGCGDTFLRVHHPDDFAPAGVDTLLFQLKTNGTHRHPMSQKSQMKMHFASLVAVL